MRYHEIICVYDAVEDSLREVLPSIGSYGPLGSVTQMLRHEPDPESLSL